MQFFQIPQLWIISVIYKKSAQLEFNKKINNIVILKRSLSILVTDQKATGLDGK